MKAGLLAWICLACSLVLGCRTNPNQVLMEREHRELEDENFDLQDQLEHCQRELEALRQQNGGPARTGPATGTIPPVDRDVAPPRVIRPPSEIPPLPKIDLGASRDADHRWRYAERREPVVK